MGVTESGTRELGIASGSADNPQCSQKCKGDEALEEVDLEVVEEQVQEVWRKCGGSVEEVRRKCG